MWTPVMTSLQPAPDAILHLVKCGCSKERCSSNRCRCRKAGLNCTDLCNCSNEDDACENVSDDDHYDEENNADSSEDEEESSEEDE